MVHLRKKNPMEMEYTFTKVMVQTRNHITIKVGFKMANSMVLESFAKF